MYKWNLDLICKADEWQKKYDELDGKISLMKEKVNDFLGDIDSFLEFLTNYIDINMRIETVYCYPRRNLDLNLKDEHYKEMLDKALDLYQKILKLGSIFENKLISNLLVVNEYLKDERLYVHRRYINLIVRKGSHGIASDSKAEYERKIQDIKSSYQALFNNGFSIENLNLSDRSVDLNRFNYNDLILDSNQKNREIIFNAYTSEYEKYNKVLADLYIDKLKNDIDLSKKEGYSSLLLKKLFELEIDDNIVESLIRKVNSKLDIMHSYTRLKKQALGLSKLHFYDSTLSLCSIPKITYSITEAIMLIKNSLSVLGDEYVNLIDKMFNEGWIDVFPIENKRSSSFTCISYVGAPYVLVNFDGSINSVRTLAHEIGHAMNVYCSKNKNSFEYFEFSYFLTEIASKVNEHLFNHYMINNCKSEEEKIYILNNIISSLGNSLFGQVMLTEFEHTIINKIANYKDVDSDVLNDTYLDISKKYNGPDMVYTDNIKYGWSKIQHFIMQDSYYLYQYSIGAAIASNISKRIIDREPLILDKYTKFLSAGNSVSIKEALAYLDIDLGNGEYIDNAFSVLDDSIKELRKIKRL